MRRILIEAARHKRRVKHGGDAIRVDFDGLDIESPQRPDFLLALDSALEKLAAANPQASELVKLRYFAGLTNVESAALLGVSPRKANQIWAYARAWLLEELDQGEQ
jgi:RNA polymerase sigma factor (TIGR02999 family)